MQAIRVAVADDNPEISRIVVDLLEPDFKIVGTYFNGSSVLRDIERVNPDVLVLDISLGDVSGFEVAEKLAQQHFPVKIVFLTVHENVDFVRAAFDMGASGYVFKSRISLDLVAAIRAVSAGEQFVPSSLTHRL